MKRTIVRVTPSKKEAQEEATAINNSLRERGIKRRAYVCKVSRSCVKKLTRKGYPIPKQSYGIEMKDLKAR